MDEIKELPNDVVVNILSRLPVRNLHRLKTVCKSWEALISDPIFAGVHLRRSKSTSFNQDLFYWHEQQCEGGDDCLRGYRRILKDKQKELATKFPLVRNLDRIALCYCDGLSLRRYPKLEDKMYVLHNLSSNTYIQFSCPYPIYHHAHTTLYGICYDPVINDYKVVIINSNHYAVFHCRNQHWSEMKEITKDNFSRDEVVMGKGASLNGDMYWILQTKEEEEGGNIRFGMEIVGFDSTREKFKKLPKPNYKRENHLSMFLTCWKGYLYLSNSCNDNYQMIKVEDADDEEVYWMEFDGTLPLLLSYWAMGYYAMANPEDTTVLKAGNDWFTTVGYFRIPYLQNMFISSRSSHNKQVSKRRSSWKPLDIYRMLFPRSKQHN